MTAALLDRSPTIPSFALQHPGDPALHNIRASIPAENFVGGLDHFSDRWSDRSIK
ncbi:hypothetical protein [Aurantimonas sp. VKM B-3413]|uniref:hypothetical protein n=1 Tax=Aurantimonas sp. VKM B-3413 TaxID=2779401 RepID=UPI001E525795|nr:hypothetical protein [Aurantimonas sp. VKM B-3413]MCB8836220.1 hypothetical protein [Aurantimonas sp. VKM B-3413]